MVSETDYALLAANAYAVKESVTSEENKIPIPDGWLAFMENTNDNSGFIARAYTSDTEDV